MELSRARLITAIPVHVRQNRLSQTLASSMLYWADEQSVAKLPDFFFSFDLRLHMSKKDDEGTMNESALLKSLLYHYTRAMGFPGKKREFDMSLEAQRLRIFKDNSLARLAAATGVVNNSATLIQNILGKAAASELDVLFAARYPTRRPFGAADGDDEGDDNGFVSEAEMQTDRVIGERNRFFEVMCLHQQQQLYRVRCRTHVMAMTMVAYLLPHPMHPLKSDPVEKLGRRFYLDNVQATGVLLGPTGKTLFRYDQTPANVAVSVVARQLGQLEPLFQQRVICVNERAEMAEVGDALLLAPAPTPFVHPVFSKAVTKPPKGNLLVSTCMQPEPSADQGAEVLFHATLLPLPGSLRWLGLLSRDCFIEKRFATAAPKPPKVLTTATAAATETTAATQVTQVTQATGTPPAAQKRTFSELEGAQWGNLPRTKRARLFAGSLAFAFLLARLQKVTSSQALFKAGLSPDYVEVLFMLDQEAAKLPPHLRHACAYLAVAQQWHAPESNVIRRALGDAYDATLVTSLKEDATQLQPLLDSLFC